MVFRRRARLLVAVSMTVAALTGGAGTAFASPDPGQQPDIPSIDEWPIEYPTMLTNPGDKSGSSDDWDGVGMICQNLHANCA